MLPGGVEVKGEKRRQIPQWTLRGAIICFMVSIAFFQLIVATLYHEGLLAPIFQRIKGLRQESMVVKRLRKEEQKKRGVDKDKDKYIEKHKDKDKDKDKNKDRGEHKKEDGGNNKGKEEEREVKEAKDKEDAMGVETPMTSRAPHYPPEEGGVNEMEGGEEVSRGKGSTKGQDGEDEEGGRRGGKKHGHREDLEESEDGEDGREGARRRGGRGGKKHGHRKDFKESDYGDDGKRDGGHHRGRGDGKANPVVVLLSEGRGGSTVTGSLLLEHHPHCGQFHDELVWLVFRQHLASSEDPDRTVAIDQFLNTTQCSLGHRLWDDADTVGSWLHKRSQYANQEMARPKDYFDRERQWSICREVGESQSGVDPKAVCAKEIRFQGFVKELMQAASTRGVPLSVIYLIRDPRPTTFSQMWTFPTTRLKQRDLTIQSAEVLTNICKTALRDLESVGMPPPGVIAEEFCFEDLLTDPKGAVARLFSRLPGMGSVIPPYVDAYGKSHVLGWRNGFGANFTGGGMRGKEGRGGGVDHRFSSDISRGDHVGKWKETWQYLRLGAPDIQQASIIGHANLKLRTVPRYELMRREWRVNKHCVKLKRSSKCSARWPEIEFNASFLAEAYSKRFNSTLSEGALASAGIQLNNK